MKTLAFLSIFLFISCGGNDYSNKVTVTSGDSTIVTIKTFTGIKSYDNNIYYFQDEAYIKEENGTEKFCTDLSAFLTKNPDLEIVSITDNATVALPEGKSIGYIVICKKK